MCVWHGHQPREMLAVWPRGVVERRIAVGQRGGLLHAGEHELLVDYREDCVTLQFSGGGVTDSAPVVSALQRAHHAVVGSWRPMTRYLNRAFTLPKFLRYPGGILAHGPRSLLSSYAAVLEAHGMHTLLSSDDAPLIAEAKRKVGESLQVLIFCPEALYGHTRKEPPPSFVIASSFEANDPTEHSATP